MSEIADDLKGLMGQLKAENAKLKGDLANIHAALRPFIAGGSEYSEVSGDLRAIQEIGERGKRAAERSIGLAGKMKELEVEAEWLRGEAEMYLEVLQRIVDGTLAADQIKAEAAQVINACSPEVTGRPRR